MSDSIGKDSITPQDMGGFLYYFVGSKTAEFLNNEEKLEQIGLAEVDRDDLYIETAIFNMFLMVKQYTGWEKDETTYTKALDQMHFMLFHQLKELSNYDQDDIEQLHSHIFRRYDEYGQTIQEHDEANWLVVLCRLFLENLHDDLEDMGRAVGLLAKEAVDFYQEIPKMLNSL